MSLESRIQSVTLAMAKKRAHKCGSEEGCVCVCSYFSSLYFPKCLQLVTSGLKADWQRSPGGSGLQCYTHLCVHSFMHPLGNPSLPGVPGPLTTLQGLIVGGRKEKREKQEHTGVGFTPAPTSQPMASYLPVSQPGQP